MKTVTLDFTNCKYISQIYRIIKKEFDFPDYFGENLDALWDLLDGYCDFDLHVYIKGLDTLPPDFAEYMRKMLEVFDDVHEENPNITFEVI